MGQFVSRVLHLLVHGPVQRGIDELTEMHYDFSNEGQTDFYPPIVPHVVDPAGLIKHSSCHSLSTAGGFTNYHLMYGDSVSRRRIDSLDKLRQLAEMGKLSHLKKVVMEVSPRQCSTIGPAAGRATSPPSSSFFECFFKLTDPEEEGGESSRKRQCHSAATNEEADHCIRMMEEGILGAGRWEEPTLVGAKLSITRDLHYDSLDSTHNEEMDLATILGLNASYMEVRILTIGLVISSPPPLLSDALAGGSNGGSRFGRITKLLLHNVNYICSDDLKGCDGRPLGRDTIRECWMQPFPAKEWAHLITRLFTVCGALEQLLVEIHLGYLNHLEDYRDENLDLEYWDVVTDRYWMAIDSMRRELRAISGGGGIVVTGGVEVGIKLDIPQYLLEYVPHDHPIFREGDSLQIRSYERNLAEYFRGELIREGERRMPDEGEEEESIGGGGIGGRGAMLLTWYVHSAEVKNPPELGYLHWMRKH